MEEKSSFSLGNSRLMPQEEMLEVGKKKASMSIGIPRESNRHESRVPVTPEAVELLVNNGHQVLIEENAGKEASYLNTDYSECGGTISKREEVFRADVILKVAPLTTEESELLNGNQVVISALHLPGQKESYIRKLIAKRMTAIAYEDIKDKYNSYPVVRSMSEIAGIASVQIAAEHLSNVHDGKGVLLGGITGITPAEVIVLGAGTAGEYATRAALGLGAMVKVFDHSVHRLRKLQNYIGERISTSVFHPRVLQKALRSADVLIGAVHQVDKDSRYFITEEMVMGMKKGSVIVDISIDQGGCVETSECRTHKDPVYTRHGVIHYCVPNIPSRVARTASIALSNVFTPILLEIGEAGGIKQILKEDPGLRRGVYLFNGILTSQHIGKMFGMQSKDLDLLLAAF
ncbi:MAG TPA: alanine dehydrogenase [Bacteroidetes bacterium]|nr:alanine dehydrogenase [Bacteroidota bacterium]